MSRFPNSASAKKALPFMGKFLAYKGGLTKEIMAEFARYRGEWRDIPHREPADKRGRYLMMLYRMASSSSEKKEIARDFAGLPKTEDNREANAYAQLAKVEAFKDRVASIKLTHLKTLGKMTVQRVTMLDQLQSEVTTLVKMKVGEPAIEGLNLLGDAYIEMASAIRTAPVPSALQGADLQKYLGIVREKAKEFEDKGREAERLSAEKAKELSANAGS